jgi:N-methylhydantoinase B
MPYHAAAGGGYGNPLLRDSKLVEQDVILDYVSVVTAREDHGVVISPGTMAVDTDATERLAEDTKQVMIAIGLRCLGEGG